MRHERLQNADDAALTIDVFREHNPEFDLDAFIQLMRNYGFVDQWELELLVSKWFYKMTLRQIADEFGWLSFSTVRWKLKKLNEELVKRGFEQELE